MPELPPAAGVPRILIVAGCADLLFAAIGWLNDDTAVIVMGLVNAGLLLVSSRQIVEHRVVERKHREIMRESWRRHRGR
jgi:hypothetical protein